MIQPAEGNAVEMLAKLGGVRVRSRVSGMTRFGEEDFSKARRPSSKRALATGCLAPHPHDDVDFYNFKSVRCNWSSANR
jgi:hypothetical protein